MKQKNILHLLSSNKYSGAENVACTIIKNTKENSYYCSPNGPIKENLEEKGITYIPLKSFTKKSLKKVIKDYHIDIIHAHDLKASFLASLINGNIKKISHLHCNYDLYHTNNLYSLIYKHISKKFNKIIMVSDEIYNEAVFKDYIADRAIILRNVVDPKEITKLSKDFETKKYDLIFVARVIEVKRPLFFIDLVKDLKQENKNIKAAILGQGDLYDECKKHIKDNDLEENIDLLGFKNNPFPYVKNSKIEVLPSKYEGLPMSTIESLILNVPVVNSGAGGLKKLCIDHPELVCETKEEYLTIIKKLLTTKQEEKTKICQDILKKNNDTKTYFKEIEKIYKEL